MTKKLSVTLRVLIALAISAAIAAGVYFYYLRPQYKQPGELAGLLPRSDAVLFYADVEALRAAGILKMLEGAKSVQEADYQHFVTGTGFDYERDLDALAVASVPNQLFAVLRGRFDWKRLASYAKQQGGSCRGTYCHVPNPKSGRWLSFFPIRSNVMAVAASADTNAAYSLLPRRGAPAFVAPSYPAWVQVPKRVIEHPDALPAAAQVFVRSLSPASEVTFGIESAPDRPQDGFLVRMMAQYSSEKEAQNVSEHLTQLTKLLGALAGKKRQDTSDAGLRELLESAAFIAGDKQVKGQWHLSRRFIDSILE